MNAIAQRLPLNFNARLLQADLAKVADSDWQAHFNNAIYEGDWSGAALRAVPGSHMSLYSDPSAHHWEDTELLGRCPYFQEALAQFCCPLLSVRLLKLAAGAVIREHRDYNLGLDYGEVRIHVVVSTNPDVESRIDGTPYHWAEGECWYADFGRPHFFANRGSTERVHLVLDCGVNDWLLQLLATTEAPSPDIPPPTPATLAWLFRQAQNDPELKGRLFAMTDTDSFIALLAEVAHADRRTLNTEELKSIINQTRQAWLERDLP